MLVVVLLLACVASSNGSLCVPTRISVSNPTSVVARSRVRMGLFDGIADAINRMSDQRVARISHVMLRTDTEACNYRTRGECYEMLTAWKERIGDDEELFKICAEERSECASQAKGGDLGFLTPAAKGFAREFCETAFSDDTEPGKVYGPIETQVGLHLVYIHEIR